MQISTLGKLDIRDHLVFDPPDELSCVLHLGGRPGAGNTIFDNSAYGNHGTITGATWVRLPNGLWANYLDGVDDLITITHSTSLILTNNLATFSVWINPSVQLTDYPQIFAKYNNDSSNGFSLSMPQNMGTMYWQIFDGVENAYASMSTGLVVNTWHNIICRKTSTQLELYRNGSPAGNAAYTVEPHDNGINLLVGAMFAGENPIRLYKGYIVIFEYCKSTLTPAGIFNQERHLFGV